MYTTEPWNCSLHFPKSKNYKRVADLTWRQIVPRPVACNNMLFKTFCFRTSLLQNMFVDQLCCCCFTEIYPTWYVLLFAVGWLSIFRFSWEIALEPYVFNPSIFSFNYFLPIIAFVLAYKFIISSPNNDFAPRHDSFKPFVLWLRPFEQKLSGHVLDTYWQAVVAI